MPIRRRLLLLTVSSALGGLLFAPFVLEGMRAARVDVAPPLSVIALIFCIGSALVAALCSWLGLRFSDRTDLPMPILRAWEQSARIPEGALPRILSAAIAGGLAAGLLVGAVVHLLHLPPNPGTLTVRLLTVFFAATITEIIVHLFAMSGLFLLFHNRWIAIFLSSVLFVLIFHSGQIGGPWMTALVVFANFSFGTLTGWLYTRYGFECAVLTHAVAHLIALGWN
jgi:hypothetical protein